MGLNRNSFLAFAALLVAVWVGGMAVMVSSQGTGLGDSSVALQAQQGSLGGASGQGVAGQDVYLRALNNGTYNTQEIVVKKGIPVRLHFTADPDAGCGRALLIRGLNLRAVSQNGEEQVVSFIPQEEATYDYSCTMGMWKFGKIIVRA